jgi:hypothetical protein
MLAMIIIGLPTLMIMLIANRFFKFREKKLEVEALNAAEKAAQYAREATNWRSAFACSSRSSRTAERRRADRSPSGTDACRES